MRQVDLFSPAFHKLGKDGYDGRGVQRIATESDLDKAFDAPGLLEKAVDFEKEIAVIVARNPAGDMKTFPVVEMVFHPEHNLVEYLFAPAEISNDLRFKAEELASRTAEAFGIVGILAVEMFVTKNGEILINEVAPRPHNSGHQTIRASLPRSTSSIGGLFWGLPLGSTHQYAPAAMVNLLGEEGHTGPPHLRRHGNAAGDERKFSHFSTGKPLPNPTAKWAMSRSWMKTRSV